MCYILYPATVTAIGETDVKRRSGTAMKTNRQRRRFLQWAASAPVFARAAFVAARQNNQRTPRVDTHLHCFAGRNDPRFPYHDLGPYRPAERATPERLLECMDGAGVDFAVAVHPEPYQDDHRNLEPTA